MTLSRLLFWDAGVLAGRIGLVIGVQWIANAVVLIFSAFLRSHLHDDKSF